MASLGVLGLRAPLCPRSRVTGGVQGCVLSSGLQVEPSWALQPGWFLWGSGQTPCDCTRAGPRESSPPWHTQPGAELELPVTQLLRGLVLSPVPPSPPHPLPW